MVSWNKLNKTYISSDEKFTHLVKNKYHNIYLALYITFGSVWCGIQTKQNFHPIIVIEKNVSTS